MPLKLPQVNGRAIESTGERIAVFERDGIDTENRTAWLAFSSETPVQRWYGWEVLDHDPNSIRLDRLRSSGPLLADHNTRDHIGVVRKVEIGADRKARAQVQFSRSARGQEIFQDVLDGIRANVSVGYQIHQAEKDGVRDDEPVIRATDWEPYEVSMVSVPADTAVGIGRSAQHTQEKAMPTKDKTATEETAANENRATAPESTGGQARATESATPVNVVEIENKVRARELQRMEDIRSLGEQYRDQGGVEIADELIRTGAKPDAFAQRMLERLGRKSNGNAAQGAVVDLSEREHKQYSLLRALNAAATGDWSEAGLEREVSQSIAKKQGRSTQGFFVPMNLRAPYAAGTSGSGSEFVQTDVLAGEMIHLLRAQMLVVNLGARMMSGLVGDVAIPRQISGATGYWVGENAAITDTEATFDQVTLSPKTVGALSTVSRQMLMQTSADMEAVIRQDLTLAAAQAIDAAAITGAGASGEPTGILNTTGIGSVAIGTNGGALTIDQIIDLRKTVAKANALRGRLAFLTNPDVTGTLQKLKSTTGQYLWDDDVDGSSAIAGVPGMIKGYKVGESTHVPNNLTKGTGTNLSAVIFGNFSDLLIGEWGAMEVVVNPYGTGFANGQIQVRVMHMVDVAVRHAASFAAVTDAITN